MQIHIHSPGQARTCHAVRRRWILFPAMLLLLLTACGGGATVVRYYLVDPVAYTAVPASQDSALAIEILEVHVPQYLERFQIATRRDANRLHFSDTSQWGENLRKNLMRTLARNLSVLLGSNDVGTPLNRSMSLPDYRIQVHIEQFERDSEGSVRLIARWQVSGKESSATPITMKVDLRGSSPVAEDDFDRIVAEMQQLFGQLSQRIAESVSAAVNAASGQVGT